MGILEEYKAPGREEERLSRIVFCCCFVVVVVFQIIQLKEGKGVAGVCQRVVIILGGGVLAGC